MMSGCTKGWINKIYAWNNPLTQTHADKWVEKQHTHTHSVMRTAGEGAGGCTGGKKQRGREGGREGCSLLLTLTLPDPRCTFGVFPKGTRDNLPHLYTTFFISPSWLIFLLPSLSLQLPSFFPLFLFQYLPSFLSLHRHNFLWVCVCVWERERWGRGEGGVNQSVKEEERQAEVRKQECWLKEKETSSFGFDGWMRKVRGQELERWACVCLCVCVCVCK